MTRLLTHRGPDGEGYYCWPQSLPRVALGMCRLSILDLETGDQPIFNEDRSIAVVFNGEIYNYIELRSSLEGQGHFFRTQPEICSLPDKYIRSNSVFWDRELRSGNEIKYLREDF